MCVTSYSSPAVSTADWQNWAWSNPVAGLFCWKSCSSTGGRGGDFALQLNPIHHTASFSTDLATQPCFRLRAGQCQHCWLLYLVGLDREPDPPKDIFVYIEVILWQQAQGSVHGSMKTKSTPNVRQRGKNSAPQASFGRPITTSVAFTHCLQSLFLVWDL